MSKRNTYSVMFEGKLLEGYDTTKSLKCLRTKLKLHDATIKKIVSSNGKPLLENVSHETASKMADSLKSCGLMAKVISYEQQSVCTNNTITHNTSSDLSFSSLIIKKYGLAFTIYNCVALLIFLYIIDIYTRFELHTMSALEVAFVSAIFCFPLFIVASSALTVRKIRLAGTALEGSAFKWWASSSGVLSRFLLYIGVFSFVIAYIIGLQEGSVRYIDSFSLIETLTELPISFLVLFITFNIVKRQSVSWLVPFRTYFLSINASAAFKTVFFVLVLFTLLLFTSLADSFIEISLTSIRSQESSISIIKWTSELIIWKNKPIDWFVSYLGSVGTIIEFVGIVFSTFCSQVVLETVYVVYMTNFLSVHDAMNNKLCKDSNINRNHGYRKYVIVFLMILSLNFCILKFVSVDIFSNTVISAVKEKTKEELNKQRKEQIEKLPLIKRKAAEGLEWLLK